MKSKYLPEVVLMWITVVFIVALVTSCSSSRATQTPQPRAQGESGWKYVELKGNKH
jgi:hypothetical protein